MDLTIGCQIDKRNGIGAETGPDLAEAATDSKMLHAGRRRSWRACGLRPIKDSEEVKRFVP
jgi:hypothetical protein